MVDGANQTFNSAAKKCQIFSFQDVQNGRGGTKSSAPPQRGQKIIENQSKPILVIVSIKPFTRVSGKIIFHAKLSGRFLLRKPLKVDLNKALTYLLK